MLLRKSAPEKTVLSNDKPFYRAFPPRPEERSDFANLAGELLAITNRRLGEPDLTSFCSRGCEPTKVVPRVRIPPSPPASLNCRETAPPVAAKYAKHARISQYFVSEVNRRERTAWDRRASICGPFSRGHIRSSGFNDSIGRMQ